MTKKIIKVFILSFSLFIFVSCTNTADISSDAILGTWLLESAAIDGKTEDIQETNLSYIFNDDGVVLQNTGGNSIVDGTYEITGSTVTMQFPGGEFTAKIEQEKLVITQSSCTYTFAKKEG